MRLISSFTNGVPELSWRVLLLTYQGASKISLSILDPAIVDEQKMAPNLGVSPSSYYPATGIRNNSGPVDKFWKNRLP
jgi:hypothetical protein